MEPMWSCLRTGIAAIRRDETGAVESAQIFAWIVVTVIAIVAVGAMMEALGVDVINWVRAQIGI